MACIVFSPKQEDLEECDFRRVPSLNSCLSTATGGSLALDYDMDSTLNTPPVKKQVSFSEIVTTFEWVETQEARDARRPWIENGGDDAEDVGKEKGNKLFRTALNLPIVAIVKDLLVAGMRATKVSGHNAMLKLGHSLHDAQAMLEYPRRGITYTCGNPLLYIALGFTLPSLVLSLSATNSPFANILPPSRVK
mmetsp:Transcript_113869/g.179225  ORF Transcript_113869/g.179225 Transcript_113869/m.179225 type:complete len:193 (-) Transcript_113869:210-788(-)